ncbi:MAG: hypothetical protein EB127_28485 [Alphaproteobacteria bacterium]|nr:hypothetical protein [Alphaproteobacteria bacterium]
MVGSLPYDERKGCPDGFHKRSSYTSKRGHRVSPRCVKAQTVYRETRKNYSRRILRRQEERLERAHRSGTSKLRCPPGKIRDANFHCKSAKKMDKYAYKSNKINANPTSLSM